MSDEEDEHDFSKDPCLEETWTTTTLRGKCPKCKKVNYVDLGDFNDSSAPTVEAVRCWSCKTLAWLDTEFRDMAQDMGHDSIEDAYEADGTENS